MKDKSKIDMHKPLWNLFVSYSISYWCMQVVMSKLHKDLQNTQILSNCAFDKL